MSDYRGRISRLEAPEASAAKLCDELHQIGFCKGRDAAAGIASEADEEIRQLRERAEHAEAERDRLREAAKEFLNATLASQRDCQGFGPERHVLVGATHLDLVDRINRAADELEASVKETPAPAAPGRIICEPTHDGRASECYAQAPKGEADG
jgi:hypothetical protein